MTQTLLFSNDRSVSVPERSEMSASEYAIWIVNHWLHERLNFAEVITMSAVLASGCRWAGLTQLNRQTKQVDVLAMVDNHTFMDCFSYDLEKTPCEKVIESGLFLFYQDVQYHFPDDHDLVEMDVKDYAGCACTDANGQVFGHLMIMHDKEITDYSSLESIISALTTFVKLEMPR